jgi:hypothetical protein
MREAVSLLKGRLRIYRSVIWVRHGFDLHSLSRIKSYRPEQKHLTNMETINPQETCDKIKKSLSALPEYFWSSRRVPVGTHLTRDIF